MSKLVIRPATLEDLMQFGDIMDKPTIRAWCGDIDGRIIGVGGFYFYQGRWFGFCDLKDEARRYKVAFMRTAKMVMTEMQRSGHRILYAGVDPSFPMAPRWIESLGFKRQATGIWKWQQYQQ